MLLVVEVVVLSVQISKLEEGAKGIATRSGKASWLSHKPREWTCLTHFTPRLLYECTFFQPTWPKQSAHIQKWNCPVVF